MGQRAAIYCRVSTADQTCARQEADLLAFAGKAGFPVTGIWKETASGSKDDRPERKSVLELVAAGQSYREVGPRLGISKNTVLGFCVKRLQKYQ